MIEIVIIKTTSAELLLFIKSATRITNNMKKVIINQVTAKHCTAISQLGKSQRLKGANLFEIICSQPSIYLLPI